MGELARGCVLHPQHDELECQAVEDGRERAAGGRAKLVGFLADLDDQWRDGAAAVVTAVHHALAGEVDVGQDQAFRRRRGAGSVVDLVDLLAGVDLGRLGGHLRLALRKVVVHRATRCRTAL
jgi:hypothetical protein